MSFKGEAFIREAIKIWMERLIKNDERRVDMTECKISLLEPVTLEETNHYKFMERTLTKSPPCTMKSFITRWNWQLL